MKEISFNEFKLNKQSFSNNRDRIKGMAPAIFNVMDMLVTLEHLQTLMDDIFATPELKEALEHDDIKMLGKTKDLTSRWVAVRNKLGGHIDIKIVTSICEKYNFKGTLLSDDLETDIAIYNCLLLEGAVNIARKNSDLFGRDLDFKNNLAGELSLLTKKLNSDWNSAFECFEPLIKRIYEIGKEEKVSVTSPEERQGLVYGN